MSNENLSNKPDFIKKIFDYDENKKEFTIKSQRYQHIIQFFSDNDNTLHKITEIQDKVLAKVPHIFKIDSTKKPWEIKKSTNSIFNTILDNLKNWGLLEFASAKGDKGNVQTKEYSLSKFGKMFALLIETTLAEDKQVVYGKLFDHWKSYWTDYSSSLDLFCIKYLEKCKEKNLFNEFAGFYVKSLIYGDNHYIQSIHDIFTQMTLVRFEGVQKNQTLLDLWKKTYHELDETTRQIFSNHMRLHLNRMIVRSVRDYHRYELKRYEMRFGSNLVIVEACCSGCLSNFQYFAISVISYISYLFIHADSIIDSHLKDLRCNNCKNNKFELIMNT